MRLAGYIRVSSDEQVEGVSLDAQRARLETLARTEGHDLAAIFDDPGYSASDLQRPGLQALLAGLDRGDFEGMACTKLDRITRRIVDWGWLCQHYFAAPKFVPLVIAAGAVDLHNASGRMVVNIQMAIAEFELDQLRERTSEAVAHKRSKGEVLGHAPFGYEVGPDGKTLIPDPAEQEIIARMVAWQGAGLTLRGIAKQLNEANIPARHGGQWRHPVIGRILQNFEGRKTT